MLNLAVRKVTARLYKVKDVLQTVTFGSQTRVTSKDTCCLEHVAVLLADVKTARSKFSLPYTDCKNCCSAV
jgi:hypothetical protein